MAKTFAGARLRRLREDHGLTQVALARALGLSTSYVNQLKKRPATRDGVGPSFNLSERFDLPTQYFAPDTDATVDLGPAGGPCRGSRYVQPRSRNWSPGCRRSVRRWSTCIGSFHNATADLETLHMESRHNVDISAPSQQPMPFEEVRDFFYDRKNYVGELDVAAEELFNQNQTAGRRPRRSTGGVSFNDKLGVTVVIDDGQALNPNAKRQLSSRICHVVCGPVADHRVNAPFSWRRRSLYLPRQASSRASSPATTNSATMHAASPRSAWPTTSPVLCCFPTTDS